MPSIRSRNWDSLRAYLREKVRPPFAHRDWPWGAIIPIGLIVVIALSVLGAEELPAFLLMLFVPLALIAMGASAIKISNALTAPRNADEERQMEACRTAKFLA